MITSWAAPPTWHAGHRHPGRGKYLIKSGQRVGLPIALTLTPSEIALHDTDGAFATRPDADPAAHRPPAPPTRRRHRRTGRSTQ